MLRQNNYDADEAQKSFGKNRDRSKKYGKHGILYAKKYCKNIMKTYEGMHTPRIEVNKIDSTPTLKEFSRHANIIGLIGVPLPKLPLAKSDK